MPTVPQNTYSFKFTATVRGNPWAFKFTFMNNRWSCFATPPNNLPVREATVYSGVTAWTGFPDYGCLFIAKKPVPLLNDIGSVSMYILDWTK